LQQIFVLLLHQILPHAVVVIHILNHAHSCLADVGCSLCQSKRKATWSLQECTHATFIFDVVKCQPDPAAGPVSCQWTVIIPSIVPPPMASRTARPWSRSTPIRRGCFEAPLSRQTACAKHITTVRRWEIHLDDSGQGLTHFGRIVKINVMNNNKPVSIRQ
jgi:hypothetical protein